MASNKGSKPGGRSVGSAKKSARLGQYRPLTVGDVQDRYDVHIDADPKMRLSKYARSINQPNMGKLLEKVEKNLSKAG